ncbi:hypothetical protein jhhlp_003240 [Lomentospora prolificans]|uniref:Uncharacterized protein n=1 Tax=Lomentospora prolificans TaxID=41688 RepID=A0A2N3NG77_9PEZI|nr:hypothetical protein jhhlp_003240 [Lomentospora prolificans]
MAGRQAHGRAPTAKPLGKRAGKIQQVQQKKANAKPKVKGGSTARALNAFEIASEQFAGDGKKTGRDRIIDIGDEEARPKHGRDFDQGSEDEDEGPRRKKAKPSRAAKEDSDIEEGSDEEGNRWRLGGLAEDDQDSEIESDEAFGESDDETFQGYAFRGSRSNQPKDDDDSDDDDDDESLGEDAIDLAQALDMAEEESEEEEGESGSDDDEESDAESEEETDSDDDGVEDKDVLKGLVAEFAGVDEDEDAAKSTKPKIGLKDLGLFGIKDANMKKSLKLMTKEEKETRPGASKKLDVPLPKRQQDRIDRKAAYEKTTETLDRWTETIKQNRRAEHLVFPLPQELPTAGLSNQEMQPLKAANATSELEKTMFSLLDQSGLSLNKEKKNALLTEEEHLQLSKQAKDELIAERRLQRELQSREAKKMARLKKIKSKAYHRIHRKQKLKDEMATKEAMIEAGEIDSEDEREEQDRKRALERVGARHKNSKWAKSGSKVKRAVWDDDYRAGLVDMARRDEELRKRVEGRGVGDHSDAEESYDSGSDSGDDREKLRRELERAEMEDDGAPESKLMQLKFMKREEERLKQANNELVEQIKRGLDSDNDGFDEEEEETEVGRRKFGMGVAAATNGGVLSQKKPSTKSKKKQKGDTDVDIMDEDDNDADDNAGVSRVRNYVVQGDSIAGAWSKAEPRRKSKKGSEPARNAPLDLDSSIMIAENPTQTAKAKRGKSKSAGKASVQILEDGDEADSDEGEDLDLPLAIRDQDLIARAFAGDDVVAQFEQEKEELAEEQDDKIVDNTLPGWGSWAGDGVGKREQKRNKGRFLTKVEGVKKQDRLDAKLDRVIINEKKVKKNDKYLATQIPHEFESKDQYEGTLRLPVGADWVTKETFQGATKPRVIIKQGIITPMSRPMI